MNELVKDLNYIYNYSPHKPRLIGSANFTVNLEDWFHINLLAYNIATDNVDLEIYNYEIQSANIR